MAEKEFTLDIVTPRRVVLSGRVLSFSAPGVIGGFQVLVNHAPLLAGVGVGRVKVLDAAGQEYHYAVSGGFVEVLKNRVTLLAESAERADEIDIARARAAKDRAQRRMTERAPDIDIDRARAALARALNRLHIAERI